MKINIISMGLAIVVLLAFYYQKGLLPDPKQVLGIATTSSNLCDPGLWNYVYHPKRLKILDRCKEVTGVIYSVKSEPDGDLHIRLTVDDPAVLNQANYDGQMGKLVLEPVCVGKITQKSALGICGDFVNQMYIPPIGTHVRIIGSYVEDLEHNGWREIHPVSSIIAE